MLSCLAVFYATEVGNPLFIIDLFFEPLSLEPNYNLVGATSISGPTNEEANTNIDRIARTDFDCSTGCHSKGSRLIVSTTIVIIGYIVKFARQVRVLFHVVRMLCNFRWEAEIHCFFIAGDVVIFTVFSTDHAPSVRIVNNKLCRSVSAA